jgi:hypothetical protein
MLLLLSWLTVCLPFVNESQQTLERQIERTGDPPEADNNNPLSNTNEEKAESGLALFSEYLHDTNVLERSLSRSFTFGKCLSSDLYLAYHPKLNLPPPEA